MARRCCLPMYCSQYTTEHPTRWKRPGPSLGERVESCRRRALDKRDDTSQPENGRDLSSCVCGPQRPSQRNVEHAWVCDSKGPPVNAVPFVAALVAFQSSIKESPINVHTHSTASFLHNRQEDPAWCFG